MQFPEPVRVLLVDDDDACAQALALLLQAHGFSVTRAAAPDAADPILMRDEIHVVLSDIRMPGNSQLEWTKRVLTRMPPIPVVLLTGSPELPTAVVAANLPIAGYLLKPPATDELCAVLRRAARAMRQQEIFAALARQIGDMMREGAFGADEAILQLLDKAGQALASEGRRGIKNCGAVSLDRWVFAVQDAVHVLEQTKQNFRSKELGALRQRLRALLAADLSPREANCSELDPAAPASSAPAAV